MYNSLQTIWGWLSESHKERVPYSESNHLVCEVAGLLTFDNYVNLLKIKFCHKIFNSPPRVISKNLSYLYLRSHILNNATKILLKCYDVPDILNNDLDALTSRVFFVNNEYNDYLF